MWRICWVFLLLAACGKSASQSYPAPRDQNIVDNGRPSAVNVNLHYQQEITGLSVRWQLLSGTVVLEQGELTGAEQFLTFSRRLDSTTLRFEEKVGESWQLLATFDLILDRDRNVTLSAIPAS